MMAFSVRASHRLGAGVWHHCGHASETKLRLPFFLPPLGFGHAGGVSLFLAKLFFDDRR